MHTLPPIEPCPHHLSTHITPPLQPLLRKLTPSLSPWTIAFGTRASSRELTKEINERTIAKPPWSLAPFCSCYPQGLSVTILGLWPSHVSIFTWEDELLRDLTTGNNQLVFVPKAGSTWKLEPSRTYRKKHYLSRNNCRPFNRALLWLARKRSLGGSVKEWTGMSSLKESTGSAEGSPTACSATVQLTRH